jgi:4-carboxymuconolactone decarboxylase
LTQWNDSTESDTMAGKTKGPGGREVSEQFERGLALRKEVLGEAHVGRSLAAAQDDDFMWPLQEIVTEVGWGAFWSRPGLTRQQRSLLNIGMLTALNRPHELEVHLRGGLTKKEIQEALLQTAAYCGFPACIDAFRVAKKVLAEEGGKKV